MSLIKLSLAGNNLMAGAGKPLTFFCSVQELAGVKGMLKVEDLRAPGKIEIGWKTMGKR
jgi:hypothetical protein